MKTFFLIIMTAHGLIHVLGFVKAFNIAQVNALTQPVTKPSGLMWLAVAVLFVAASVLYLLDVEYWWMIGLPAILLSQTLIFLSWKDAKLGTTATVIILLPVVMALANSLPGSYQSIFKREAQHGISRLGAMPVISEADLAKLPAPLQKYLRYAGTVGKPRVQNFRATFTGHMSRSPGEGQMDISADQYNFYDEPTRAFFIRSSMFGIPFDGLHLYTGTRATMRISVASLFRIVDAKGDTMTKGETVTMFNDMCIMAPATLIDSAIRWQTNDALHVRGTFTNAGLAVSAILTFNESGALVDFSSDDRYMTSDGLTYKNYRWTTPVRNYKDFDGRKVATEADLVWHMPEGDYTYGTFELTSIEYNCTKFKW